MITKQQAETVADAVMLVLEEKSMSEGNEAYVDIQIAEVGQIVRMMLLPVVVL